MDEKTLLEIRDLASDPLGAICVSHFCDGLYRWNGGLQRRQPDGGYSLHSPDNEELIRVIDEYLSPSRPRRLKG